jgi:hypothetical protein
MPTLRKFKTSPTMSDINDLIATASKGRWSRKKANDWYANTAWPVGGNFLPANAINQLEMWQDDTFDRKRIDKELGWAASLGMNSMRVFLHDLLWKHERKSFLKNVDTYLKIANRHKIRTMLVIFDSCWYPFPYIGKQMPPEPGVHNPGWLQSPGVPALRDEKRFDELEEYVTGIVEHFRDDDRILVWDVWNEPDNNNHMSRGIRDIADKGPVITPLLARTFKWVRAGKPSQPLTSGVWHDEWDEDTKLQPYHRVQLECSDVISFHRYADLPATRTSAEQLKRFGRPILCTEYMARNAGSTFESILPYFKDEKIAAYNWGFVAGKSQTFFPWDSWQSPYPPEPPVWFHDIFRKNGTPYREEEVELIRKVTGATASKSRRRAR